MAAPSLPVAAANPVAELAGPAGKVQQAADKVGDALPGPAKGALAPDVEGQRRECTVLWLWVMYSTACSLTSA
jgi:hypothetical protein